MEGVFIGIEGAIAWSTDGWRSYYTYNTAHDHIQPPSGSGLHEGANCVIPEIIVVHFIVEINTPIYKQRSIAI